MTSDEDARYCLEQCKKLIGYQIVSICEDPENNSYGLMVEKIDGPKTDAKLCWIDCDPEGNGPGFLQIEDA